MTAEREIIGRKSDGDAFNVTNVALTCHAVPMTFLERTSLEKDIHRRYRVSIGEIAGRHIGMSAPFSGQE
jgi:hypothetical protein